MNGGGTTRGNIWGDVGFASGLSYASFIPPSYLHYLFKCQLFWGKGCTTFSKCGSEHGVANRSIGSIDVITVLSARRAKSRAQFTPMRTTVAYIRTKHCFMLDYYLNNYTLPLSREKVARWQHCRCSCSKLARMGKDGKESSSEKPWRSPREILLWSWQTSPFMALVY